jgi:hypothetical protein
VGSWSLLHTDLKVGAKVTVSTPVEQGKNVANNNITRDPLIFSRSFCPVVMFSPCARLAVRAAASSLHCKASAPIHMGRVTDLAEGRRPPAIVRQCSNLLGLQLHRRQANGPWEFTGAGFFPV